MWKLSGLAIHSKVTSSNSPHVCFFCCLYCVYRYLIFSCLFGTLFHCWFLSPEYKWTFVFVFTFTSYLNETCAQCLEQKKRYKINNQVKWMRRLRFCSSQLTASFLISYCKKSVPLERHWDTMILINLLSLAVWNSKTNFLFRWNTYKDKYNYCRIQGSKI